jgi:pimeloyl-ACP methyl ester carboxylesterase
MTFRIPFVEFGGAGPLLHFASANGFPPGSYRQFLTGLAKRYRPLAMLPRPLWDHALPDASAGFRTFGDDLLRFCEQEGLRQVIGVGHSLGAVATMYAAVERPELFSRLVLIEPIFLPPHILAFLAANPGIVEEGPPEDAAGLGFWPALLEDARKRRTHWENRRHAFERFRTKGVFNRFSDEVLRDYVAAGTRELPDGTAELAYSREWEATIFARPPLDVWENVAQLRVPTIAVRAGKSDTLAPAAWRHWQKLQPGARFYELPEATHLLTFETPQRVADAILTFLESDE